jgi:hypothetical protein
MCCRRRCDVATSQVAGEANRLHGTGRVSDREVQWQGAHLMRHECSRTDVRQRTLQHTLWLLMHLLLPLTPVETVQ